MHKILFLIGVLLSVNSFAKTFCFDAVGGGTTDAAVCTTQATASNSGDTLKKVIETIWSAGDIITLKPGTYTLTGGGGINGTARDGSTTLPLLIIGVKSSCADTGSNLDSADLLWGDTTNYPTIHCDSVALGDYPWTFFIRGVGNGLNARGVFIFPTGAVSRWNIFQNDTNASVDKYAVVLSSGAIEFMYNKVVSEFTRGISSSGLVQFNFVTGSRTHIQGYGIYGGGVIQFNTVHNWFRGISNSSLSAIIQFNSISACSTSVYHDGANRSAYTGNYLFGNLKYGFYSTSKTNHIPYLNNYGTNADNVDMYYNVEETTLFKNLFGGGGDPGWTDISNGKDSVAIASPAYNNGLNYNYPGLK